MAVSRFVPLLVLVIALAGAQLLTPPPSDAQGTAAPCQRAPTPGNSEITLSSGGAERTAIVHVPPAAAGQRLPLLLALHGFGGKFFEPYSGFSVVADAEGFIALYPNPLAEYDGLTYWNLDESAGGPDDVQFISELLEDVEGELCVDTSRVYAAGVSNGGSMAALLACELSSRFAAIASIAGGYSLPPCEASNPVSVIEVHGTADPVVPYNGSPPDGAGAVRTWLAEWRARDGCASTQSVSRIAPRVERYVWSGCAQGSAVEHLEIFGGGHQLPGALPPDAGQTSTISAAWLVWEFLSRHQQAGAFGEV